MSESIPFVLAAFGLLLGLAGYSLFRILIFVLGCAGGAFVGQWIGETLGSAGGALFGLLVGGVLGGGIAVLTIDLALCLFGWKVGFLLGMVLGIPLGPAGIWTAAVLCGVLGGFVALKLKRFVIVCGTAFVGALLETDALTRLLVGDQLPLGSGLLTWSHGRLPPVASVPPSSAWLILLTIAVTMFVFVSVQLRTLRRRRPASEMHSAATAPRQRRIELSGAYYERAR